MLRELSEDVRILVKDRLRDLRTIVRQHRHDNAPGRPTPADAREQPFPIREIEGFLGHAASAFDDVMSLAESLAPRNSLGGAPVAGPQPLQSYFRAAGDSPIDGERAFRRDLYRLAKLVLLQKKLNDFRIGESEFAAVHGALEKRDAALIARLHAQTGRDERVSLVAALSSSLFVELVRRQPIKLPAPASDEQDAIDLGPTIATNCLASIAIACGLATLDMEGAAGPELMEIAVLAVDARADRIRAALDSGDQVQKLTPLFASLLTHLN
ncbi:MAG TPA: hypothetical protein VIZ90_04800 [Rhizobiaceae bacterium]